MGPDYWLVIDGDWITWLPYAVGAEIRRWLGYRMAYGEETYGMAVADRNVETPS